MRSGASAARQHAPMLSHALARLMMSVLWTLVENASMHTDANYVMPSGACHQHAPPWARVLSGTDGESARLAERGQCDAGDGVARDCRRAGQWLWAAVARGGQQAFSRTWETDGTEETERVRTQWREGDEAEGGARRGSGQGQGQDGAPGGHCRARRGVWDAHMPEHTPQTEKKEEKRRRKKEEQNETHSWIAAEMTGWGLVLSDQHMIVDRSDGGWVHRGCCGRCRAWSVSFWADRVGFAQVPRDLTALEGMQNEIDQVLSTPHLNPTTSFQSDPNACAMRCASPAHCTASAQTGAAPGTDAAKATTFNHLRWHPCSAQSQPRHRIGACGRSLVSS
eukprot:3941747-Rhodomonas_salina.8